MIKHNSKISLALVFTPFIAWATLSYAGEVIAGFDKEKDLPVLNEDLRLKDQATIDLTSRVSTLEAVYAADTAANDTYVISLSTAPSTYTTGMSIYFKATTANTGACTLNVNNLGAKSLKSLHDQDPADNYIEAGSIVHVVYDGTNFQIMSPDANP